MSTVVNELAVLMVFLLIGFALREIIKPLQKLFLPAGLIGGILALILGPQVLGLVTLPEGWGVMSVFTYWGGHGAGASSGQLFEDLGVPGMLSMGIVLSTLGLIVAMAVGMILVNVGVRRGYANYVGNIEGGLIKTVSGPIAKEKQKSLGSATVASDAINGLAMQLALVLGSMWLGTKLFDLLKMVAPAASKIPSLLYGIVGALIVWSIMRALHLDGYADKKTIDNISGVALEICICSATATLNLKMFLDNLVPILIHMVIIVVTTAFICMVLVKRWLKKDWFETALLFFGQSTGSSPSGLALARCTDPETKNSAAWEGFGVAVGVFSPISSMLVAVLPVLTVQSVWLPIGIGAVLTVVLVLFGELVIRKKS